MTLPFRDRSVAASLKLLLPAVDVQLAAHLPRPFGRGLIEASCISRPPRSRFGPFRDRSVAASLKRLLLRL